LLTLLTLNSINFWQSGLDNCTMRATNHSESFGMPLPRSVQIRVLGERRLVVAAEPLKLVGKRLIARFSTPLCVGDCIRIDLADSFVLGEVLGCWHNRGLFGAIELREQLSGLRELETLSLPADAFEPEAIGQSA
jgi:hypothetical protein